MTFVWTNRYGRSPDMKNCRASVHSPGDGWHPHQCTRKATIFRCVEGHKGEIGFCRQHDPDAVKARRDASYAAYQAEWAAKNAEHERQKQIGAANDAAKTALERIAAGHNDPRSLAAEVLALYPSASGIEAASGRQDATAA